MPDVSNLFVDAFDARVEHTHQKRSARVFATLRNRTEGVANAETLTMRVAGKGTATQRPSRHADIPTMNASRSKVILTPEDWFAADYEDTEDLDKMNTDDRDIIADQSVMAIERKIDEVCIAEITGTDAEVSAGSVLTVGDYTEAMSPKIALEAIELAGNQEWDDENWYCALDPHSWNQMMTYKQFANADYVGSDMPWMNRSYSRQWHGMTWFRETKLLTADAGDTKCLMYKGDAIAAVAARTGRPSFDWIGEKQSWKITNRVRAGAKRHVDPCSIQLRVATDGAYLDVQHSAS